MQGNRSIVRTTATGLNLMMALLCLLAFAGSLHAQTMNWTQETQAASWSQRDGHATVSFRGKLWVLGGRDAEGVTNDIWSSSDGINWTLETALPAWPARWGHSVTVFNDRLWLMGGTNGSFGAQDGDFNDVWSSKDGVNWTLELRNAIWQRRSGHAAPVYDDRLWIIGGFRQGGFMVTTHNDVWHSTDGVNWSVATAGASWTPRSDHGVAVFNNRMWLTGGTDRISTFHDDVWSSTDGANWTLESASAQWAPRSGHGALAYNDRLWVVGNEVNSSNPPDVWSSPDGITWTLEDGAPQWPVRGGFSCLVYRGRLWLTGGTGGLNRYNDVWSYSEPLPIMGVERSATPVLDGFDSLGGVDTGGETITWEIHNTGSQSLSLTATPPVAVTPGTGAPNVSVATQPASSVAPSGSTTFQVQVTPVAGPFDFSVSIDSNDPAADPYEFTVRGSGSNSPEISVARDGASVPHAGADVLGGVGTSGESFTWQVRNVGAQGLSLTGTPLIAVTPGAGAPTVSVTTQPAATVAPNGATTFELDVTPATFGAFDFTVSIDSNDPVNDPYTFIVRGVGRDLAGWTQETPAATWGERSFHTATAFNGQLWVMGGYDTATAGTHGDIWSSTDGVNWTQAPASGHWPARFAHAAIVFNNRLWVMGGVNGLAQSIYNDVWSSTDGVNWTLETASAGWVPRTGHAVAVFNNRLWVMGGSDAFGIRLNDVWSSSDGVNWTQEPASGHWSARAGHGLTVFKNRLWVTGGWDHSMAAYDVWSSADGVNWIQETSFAGWHARSEHGALAYNDRLWVIAGETFGFSYVYDVWSSDDGVHWIREESLAQWAGNPPANRVGHRLTVFNDTIWLTGGYASDVWSFRELPYVPKPLMGVARSGTPVPDGGVDSLGGVGGTGQTFTWEIANFGAADLDLTGTPPVAVTPGTGAPTVNVITPPAVMVPPSGTTNFQLEVIPGTGAFDFTVSIANNDPLANPYTFTVQGNGPGPNLEAQAGTAPGSSFAGGTNGPFTLSLDPGQSLSSAEVVLADPETDDITVAAVNAVGPAPAGIIAPAPPSPAHPVLLAWTGTADASNPPGVYTWQVEFADTANGTPVVVDVVITIRDLAPEHTIANAEGGDGSAGDPYRATFNQGDDSSVSIDIAHVSDPNTGQAVTVDSVMPAGMFQFSIGSGLLTAAPAATLTAADRGTHAIDVTITDGGNFVTIAASIQVFASSGAITFTTPASLPDGVVNRPYDELIEVVGATGTVEFEIVSGTLGSGLTLDSDGRLHGVPAATGSASFTVRAVDSTNDTATRQFALTVRDAGSGSEDNNGGCTARGDHGAWMLALMLAAAIAVRRRQAHRR